MTETARTQTRLVAVFSMLLATAADCPATSPTIDSVQKPLDTETVTLETLRIGMSTALSGPAAELGINMRAGVLAAFAESRANRNLADRVLELIALDDGYEPDRTTPNMHQLTSDHQVLAIVGNVGTPTATTASPIAKRSSRPFFGAFTGAGALRDGDRILLPGGRGGGRGRVHCGPVPRCRRDRPQPRHRPAGVGAVPRPDRVP